MDPWINNMSLYGQSGTPVYRQLRAYSDPNNASQQHASASNYMPFAPLYQTGLTVYSTASSNENQSDPSSNENQSDSNSPSLSEPVQKKMWQREEILCLIETYASKKDDFRNPRVRNKDIWSDISSEMQSQGHVTCDAKSCETKFKNLKRSYTACIDHNKKTGNDRKKCAFYDELHSIFHGDDNIEPPAVYSNRKGLVKRNQGENPECPTVRNFEESSEGTASEDLEEENDIKKKKPRKKPPSERSELVSLFKEFVDRKEEKEEKKLQKLQKMHDEKMTFFGQFLKVFEKSVQDK